MRIAIIIQDHFIAKNSFTTEVTFKNSSKVNKKKKKKKAKKEKGKNNPKREITRV